MNLKNVQIEGIDHADHPDYVDAFVSYAEHPNGTPLTEAELERLPSDLVYELVIKEIF